MALLPHYFSNKERKGIDRPEVMGVARAYEREGGTMIPVPMDFRHRCLRWAQVR